jgi:hypothetical protein
MNAVRVRVKNGELVLEGPTKTDLPEGKVITLLPVDDEDQFVLFGEDESAMDPAERDELRKALNEGIADIEAGRTVDAREVIARLRARA